MIAILAGSLTIVLECLALSLLGMDNITRAGRPITSRSSVMAAVDLSTRQVFRRHAVHELSVRQIARLQETAQFAGIADPQSEESAER